VTKLLSYMLRMRRIGHAARRGVKIVAAGADEYDRSALQQVATREHWGVEFTNSSEEAWMIAKQLTAPVILCERDLPETNWREAVRSLAALPHRPVVILLSKVADEYLWNEVFRIGGFDILAKPLRIEEVRRAVGLALSYWRSEAAAAVNELG
jgi:DNA-binding response OmpR family regulator